jgi:hypothetical protein
VVDVGARDSCSVEVVEYVVDVVEKVVDEVE